MPFLISRFIFALTVPNAALSGAINGGTPPEPHVLFSDTV
jgi:hypothetical protein